MTPDHHSLSEESINILLNDLLEVYGYDFTEYSKASLGRRINRLYTLDKFPDLAEMRDLLRNNSAYLNRFITEITVNVTEMFRDPAFFRMLRTTVLPALESCPSIRIWHAGCSTGEEVYSMAILLEEAGLLQKSMLYGTDINTEVLEKARKGVFPLSRIKKYSDNYILAGGEKDFSSYYVANLERAKFNSNFDSRMNFSKYNLVSDKVFNTFQLIICRNVLIYFDKELQEKVFNLLDESMETTGYLALGTKETIRFAGIAPKYKQVGKERIWMKV